MAQLEFDESGRITKGMDPAPGGVSDEKLPADQIIYTGPDGWREENVSPLKLGAGEYLIFFDPTRVDQDALKFAVDSSKGLSAKLIPAIPPQGGSVVDTVFTLPSIETIRDHERERAAKIAEGRASRTDSTLWSLAALDIAQAIRSGE